MKGNTSNLISVPEAARRAGVSRNTMRLAAQNGTISAIKPGRNWLIYADDIERWKLEQYRPNMARNHPIEEVDDGDSPTE